MFVLRSSGIKAVEPDRNTRISNLINESKKKCAINESQLLVVCPLERQDIPEALQYLKANADYTSYHLLVAVKRYYPEIYKEIAGYDKAAILCSGLSNLVYLNDWGWLGPTALYDGECACGIIGHKGRCY